MPHDPSKETIPVYGVTPETLEERLLQLPKHARAWAQAAGYKAGAAKVLTLPGEDGRIAFALLGLDREGSHPDFAAGALAGSLPAGDYRIAEGFADTDTAALAFALSAYRFGRYRRTSSAELPRLMVPSGTDVGALGIILDGVGLARDLINTPANDLGPAELADEAARLFAAHGGTTEVVVGDDLLDKGFPMVHAVGAGSDRAPRLVDCTWGPQDAPKVTLVGKGVVFDTGGLDIKPSNAMLLMKKDMGGAANVLGLASMIMAAKLPVRLRVIIPAVENAISGRAFRPGDILQSRKGITVEIGNTDAEGRLILGDALALADEEAPEILIDMATLTGAARVALGPDLPPFYTDDDTLADRLAAAAHAVNDPLWRMPLWKPYAKYLESRVADTNHINTTGGGFAGSVTAALFLAKFVEKAESWVHFDIYGWSPSERPGRPKGGEAQAIRALFSLFRERFPVDA
ncbi:leucyl aminopeptidase family protein [Stappia sp. GBMRC 2046]|uniref:Leucyl aminopeptidase family protein n=1 Tax=Stappia sediminis TaxID=2692190 RepID=A0A7X3LWH5_9HYPH|nr:leucyl aminopeptidase family protein [Stappia sediminis]